MRQYALEEMNILNALDVHSILYPKSQGVMAVESYLYGSTSISTESSIDRIKERGRKILEKATVVVKRIYESISKHKWWYAGALTLVGAFAVSSYALANRMRNETKNKDEKEVRLLAKEVREKITEMADKKKEEIKNTKTKEKPQPISKLSSATNKVTGVCKKLFSFVKETSSFISKKSDSIFRKQPGNESLGLAPILLITILFPPLGIILLIFYCIEQLIKTCRAPEKESENNNKNSHVRR